MDIQYLIFYMISGKRCPLPDMAEQTPAVKGKYKVQVDYFGTSSQKQLMPVSLRIIFYTHYGTPQQKQQETTVRLSNAKEFIEVGTFEF